MKNTDFAVISCCGQREVSLYEVSGFLTISGTGCAIEGGSYGFTAARASGVLTVGIKFPNDLGKSMLSKHARGRKKSMRTLPSDCLRKNLYSKVVSEGMSM